MKSMMKSLVFTMFCVLISGCVTAQPHRGHGRHGVKVEKFYKHGPRGKAWGHRNKKAKARHAKLMKYLKKHRHITLHHYRQLTHLSRAAALSELNAWTVGPSPSLTVVVRGGERFFMARW